MRSFLVLAFCMLSLAFVGCSKDHDDHDKDAVKASTADACPHCAGVQKATADGKCPMCGMNVSSADACAKCPGVQTVKADGTCSGCGGKVASAKM